MPSYAKNSTKKAPKTSSSRSSKARSSTRAKVSTSKLKKDVVPVIAARIKVSKKRCLAAANLIEERLEVLAMLDYKPLFSSQNNTLSGEMFDLRVIERAADIESLQATLTNVEEANAAEYQNAVNQYKSALTATEADFALLKMLILLREYATHTSRFLAFIDEYTSPEDLDLSFLGETNQELISNTTLIDFSEVIEEATTILVQLLAVLNCSVYGLSPRNLCTSSYENAEPGSIIYRYVADSSNPFVQSLYDLANISRDLTFSREMVRIREDEEPDEEYKTLIEEELGTNFINSVNDVKVSIMTTLTGTSAFSNMRRSIGNQNEIKRSNVKNYVKNKAGAMGTLLHDNEIMVAETNQISYNGTTYDTIDPLVDEAFSGEDVLDFSNFSAIIDDFVVKFQRVADFGKTSFRLLEKSLETTGAPRGDLPLVQNEQPLSMSSITAAIYEVFNRRFASTLWTSISSEFFDWLEPEHVNYTRTLGWLLIKDNPALAKEIFSAFLSDYENGFLTTAGIPEPIEGSAELDEDGNEIEGTEELAQLVNVKPGTTTPVNLAGRGARLNSKINKLNNYYAETIPQMSPTNICSTNEAFEVSHPAIRTQTERRSMELKSYFGSPNPEGPDVAGDLRLVNCMWANYHVVNIENHTISTRRQYFGSKIVAAEVIDAVLDVIKSLITPFSEVPAASDGDPIFPFVPQIINPYGTGGGYWGFSGAGYEQFQMSTWLNTVEEFNNLFTRTNSKSTYMRRQEIKHFSNKIIEIFSWMMGNYDFLEPQREGVFSGNRNGAAVTMTVSDWPDGVFLNSRTSSKSWKVLQPTCVTIKYRSEGSIPINITSTRNDCKTSEIVEDHIKAMSDMLGDLLETSFEGFDAAVEEIEADLPLPTGADGASRRLRSPAMAPALNSFASLIQSAKREDDTLAFQLDFIEKYSKRVNDYKQATTDLVNGEGSPLGEFVTMVRKLGDTGTDILQNLTVNQLALKQVALEEERADENNAYLPTLSVISKGEINSIKVLCGQNVLKAPEGSTTRILMVGIPINTFAQNKIDNDFCLRVSYRDIEYPQLVFRSKSYKFDKDLYVLPKDLDSVTTTSSFNRLLSQAMFSRIRVEVEESGDTTASIQLLDNIEKISKSAPERTGNRDIFSNLLVSEIIKLYYRVILGVSFSEASFLSTSEELKIPMSPSSASLAKSMAENISRLSTLSEGLAQNVQALVSGITSFEDPDLYVSGQIQDVDAALISDLTNAYQTRLFSPEVLRNRTLSAKMFDRIYAIPVDPDEFYIVPPGGAQYGSKRMSDGSYTRGIETPQEIFDYYLNAGIIESTGLSAPHEYKLAPRKTAEGSMAMGSVTVVLTTTDDDAEGILGL